MKDKIKEDNKKDRCQFNNESIYICMKYMWEEKGQELENEFQPSPYVQHPVSHPASQPASQPEWVCSIQESRNEWMNEWNGRSISIQKNVFNFFIFISLPRNAESHSHLLYLISNVPHLLINFLYTSLLTLHFHLHESNISI